MGEIAYGDAIEAEQADFADFFRAEYETLLRAIYLISGSRDEAEEPTEAPEEPQAPRRLLIWQL